MTVGRNDPCPCGSGKKYKKCCLAKDRATRKQTQEAGNNPEAFAIASPVVEEAVLDTDIVSEPASIPEVDPLMERINEFWEAFMDAPYEEQWASVAKMLAEEPELCDSEMVFEITNTLFGQAVAAGEIERYKQLLDELEARVPDAYATELHYILDWRISIALMEEDTASVERYFYQYSPLAGDHLDVYYQIMSALAYHGKLDILYEGMQQALPFVADSAELVPWAYDEFIEKLGDVIVLYLFDKNPDLKSDDPALLQHFAEYELQIIPDVLSQSLDYRTGRKMPSCTLDDFAFMKSKKKESAEDRGVFTCLMASFVHYAHSTGILLTKVDMAQDGLSRYFALRREGELGKQEVIGNGRNRTKKQARKRRNKRNRAQHPLCPDAKTLDEYLGQLMGFMSFQSYKAFALYELIPAWLRFLVQCDLLDEETQQNVIETLTTMKAQLIKVADNSLTDPTLKNNLLDWPYGDG